jgi:hypothetical protein
MREMVVAVAKGWLLALLIEFTSVLGKAESMPLAAASWTR